MKEKTRDIFTSAILTAVAEEAIVFVLTFPFFATDSEVETLVLPEAMFSDIVVEIVFDSSDGIEEVNT